MTRRLVVALLVAVFGLGASGFAAAKDLSDKERKQRQTDIRKMADATLQELYKVQPGSKDAIAKAAGYAVFSNVGVKIFVAGSGQGKGLAYNRKTGKTTYMKMLELQGGLGLGIKKFRLVWVFQNAADLDAFINSGWELGAQANLTAKSGDQGGGLAGAVSVKPGVYLFQLTDDGLSAEITVKGTKYYKDDDLN